MYHVLEIIYVHLKCTTWNETKPSPLSPFFPSSDQVIDLLSFKKAYTSDN